MRSNLFDDRRLQLGLLLLLAIAAYANSFPGTFILDDLTIVKTNPLVAHLDLTRIFTTDYWGVDANSGLFRPLTILSLAINRMLFGSSAAGFHAVNLILNALVVLLLFCVFSRLPLPGRAAWLAAAFFAVHPIHTEVVDEIVGRSELLAALFYFAAMRISDARHRVVAWGGVALCFSAALLSKEHAITLVAVLPLYDLARGALRERGWRRRLPHYLVLTAVAGGWLAWRQWGVVHRIPPDLADLTIAPFHYMAPLERVLTALKVQWIYLAKLLYPVGLQGIYSGDRWLTPVASPFSLLGLAVLGATALLAVVTIWRCRKGDWAGWGMLLYVVSFAPTSNVILPIGVGLAERLTYLPSAWFCLVVAVLLVKLLERLPAWTTVTVPVLLSVLLLAGTWQRNLAYASEVTLWQRDVQHDPGNPRAWINLAQSLKRAGQPVAADRTFREHARRFPHYNEKTVGYTDYLVLTGQYARAIRVGQRMEARGAGTPENRYSLARAYVALGDDLAALTWLQRCQKTYAPYANFWAVKGEALEGLGRDAEAIDAYRHSLSLASSDELPLRLGKLLLRQGRAREAEAVYRKLLRHSDVAEAWNGLGVALAVEGNSTAAVRAFSRAVALAPGVSNFRDNLRKARRDVGVPETSGSAGKEGQ